MSLKVILAVGAAGLLAAGTLAPLDRAEAQVRPAVGDVTGDGPEQAAKGKPKPKPKPPSKRKGDIMVESFSFGSAGKGASSVAAGDLDGDGKAGAKGVPPRPVLYPRKAGGAAPQAEVVVGQGGGAVGRVAPPKPKN